MKRMHWLLVIVVSFAVGQPTTFDANASAAAGGFGKLALAPAVSDNLALLFALAETELVLCLEGELRDGDLYITDFRMPHILVSEAGRVQAAGCRPTRKTVGTWHNHPAPGLAFAGSSPESLARNCYLSRTDIADFLRRTAALVSVVSCGPQTYAYWRRRDVEEAPGEVALLPPPPGQLVQAEARPDRGASDLTQARSR